MMRPSVQLLWGNGARGARMDRGGMRPLPLGPWVKLPYGELPASISALIFSSKRKRSNALYPTQQLYRASALDNHEVRLRKRWKLMFKFLLPTQLSTCWVKL